MAQIQQERKFRHDMLLREWRRAKEQGMTHKVWLSSNDQATRHDHRDADGQRKPIDQPFLVGGEALMLPNDPASSLDQTANCRCSVRYYRDDDPLSAADDAMTYNVTEAPPGARFDPISNRFVPDQDTASRPADRQFSAASSDADDQGDDDNGDERPPVVLVTPWVEPELPANAPGPSEVSRENADKEIEQNWAEKAKLDRATRKQIRQIMKDKNFRQQVDQIMASSISNDREMGSLLVYDRNGKLEIHSVGRPSAVKSNAFIPGVPDPSLGRPVFLWHPHPRGSRELSPQDLRWSATHGVPIVAQFGRSRRSIVVGLGKTKD